MRYNLSDYIVSIKPNDPTLQRIFSNVVVGGEGNMTDSITVSRTNSLWTTEGFPTGGWVHNKNLSKVGTVQISISQLSERVAKFKQMCDIFYNGDYEGFTISIINKDGRTACSCIDSYIEKVPDQVLGPTADKQNWAFTCGEVNFF